MANIMTPARRDAAPFVWGATLLTVSNYFGVVFNETVAASCRCKHKAFSSMPMVSVVLEGGRKAKRPDINQSSELEVDFGPKVRFQSSYSPNFISLTLVLTVATNNTCVPLDSAPL